MRCFVTGATGLIGSCLVRLLLARGSEVAALVRPESSAWRLSGALHRVRVIRGDLKGIGAWGGGMVEFAPEVVFHLGWYGVGGRYRDDPRQIGENLCSYSELLALARQCGCRRWVGVGSQAEYGQYSGPLREGTVANPVTLYGIAKLCAGLLSRRLCQLNGISWAWLRLLAAYGPMDDPQHVIPYVILCLLQGGKPSLTEGDQRWDYLYAEDAALAMCAAGERWEAEGAFNLASGDAWSLRAIAEQLRDLVDPGLPLGFGEVAYPAGQVQHMEADATPFRAATGWAPRWSLTEGLARTVAWYRENQWRFRAA